MKTTSDFWESHRRWLTPTRRGVSGISSRKNAIIFIATAGFHSCLCATCLAVSSFHIQSNSWSFSENYIVVPWDIFTTPGQWEYNTHGQSEKKKKQDMMLVKALRTPVRRFSRIIWTNESRAHPRRFSVEVTGWQVPKYAYPLILDGCLLKRGASIPLAN